jgi:hypothetical protein
MHNEGTFHVCFYVNKLSWKHLRTSTVTTQNQTIKNCVEEPFTRTIVISSYPLTFLILETRDLQMLWREYPVFDNLSTLSREKEFW